MSYSTIYHNVGTDPLSKYMQQPFSLTVKAFNYLVPFILNSKDQRLEIQSIRIAAEIGLCSMDFVEDYREYKRWGKEKRVARGVEEEYQQYSEVVKKLNKTVQKVLYTLEHRLNVIKRVTTHNKNQRGSKRYITLNMKQVWLFIESFDMNVREFVVDGKRINLESNRGLMIIIRKIIRNRMFSCIKAVRKFKEQYTAYLIKQSKRKNIKNVVSVKLHNTEVVTMLKEEKRLKLRAKDLSIIHSWPWPIDVVKEALHEVIKFNTTHPGYLTVQNIDKELRRVRRDTSYFDNFLLDQEN